MLEHRPFEFRKNRRHFSNINANVNANDCAIFFSPQNSAFVLSTRTMAPPLFGERTNNVLTLITRANFLLRRTKEAKQRGRSSSTKKVSGN